MTSTVRLLAICCAVSFSANWQYAYSSTYLNTPVLQFKNYLNESFNGSLNDESYVHVWDLVQNIWFIGFFLGIWLSPVLNDRLGRKKGLLIANSTNFLAAIVQFVGVWQELPVLLIIGRAVASVATAVAFQAVILYLQESPPTALRGSASYCSEVIFAAMCIVGMMLGTDLLLGQKLPWLLAVNIIPCAISILIVILVPETPKFLLIRKKDRKSAEAAIRFHHGSDADVASVVEELLHEADEDSHAAHSFRDFLVIAKEPHLRKIVILSSSAMQITVSFWGAIYNSTQFMMDLDCSDVVATWSSTIMAAIYFIGTLIGSQLIDRIGRRTLLLPCSLASIICWTAFTISFYLQKMADGWKYLGIVSLMCFAIAYGTGIGAIAWFISSELAPQRYRSLIQSICYTINTIILVAMTFALLPMYTSSIGASTFLILYCAPSLICLGYLTWQLPETKGRPTHEILHELKISSGSLARIATEDIIHEMHTPIAMTIAHFIICLIGMFTNATLFIIALTKTPKVMKTYGSVLATLAVVDFSVALSSGMTFAKNRRQSMTFAMFCLLFLSREQTLICRVEILEIYALTSPSNYFGSFLLSIHLFAVALGGHADFAYNITFCFCYRMTTPILLTIIHYIICPFGMLSNSTLLYISATKSPKEMKTYGTVLGTSAVVDFLVAVSSCLTFAKVEILEIYALTGICNYFGSFALTIHLFGVAICGHAFFAYNITLCFCFRLYAIRKGVPSKRATYTALAVCLLPNVVNVFYFASSDFIHGEEIVPELLRLNRTVIPEWTYFGISKAWFNPELPHITVYRDKIGFRTWSSIFMIVIPFPVAYLTIMMVFLQIQSALKAAASSMSSKTKEAHVEIIKCFELVVSIHPLTCLYFVRPYRIAISRSLGNASATTIQKSSQSNTSGKKVTA
ncbi:hypothetical protein PRIPAC_89354 [Pristionchus pacificus]|uniref:G protein-coupled receptor n=1 Tax=Pristionchus pacificus TaxID=54126 RepID=A0A2A6CWN8_PRIPA|nr:hypothetical protein PRIPAC_89354 [Pristionchus pacificus]|eukprot:PDM82467.1 G protein-coupled receptor [Pristionchus pacificus]